MKKEILYVVVPCYNEEESIPVFYNEITKVSKNMNIDFEYIFIDDGSTDKDNSSTDILSEFDKPQKKESRRVSLKSIATKEFAGEDESEKQEEGEKQEDSNVEFEMTNELEKSDDEPESDEKDK